MKTKNVSSAQMTQALNVTNVKYAGNVAFKRFDDNGRTINFTLRVNSSKGKGAKIGFTGRRSVAACYHSHYDFMENLFKIAPTAKITSCQESYDGVAEFNAKAGNVAHKNIGSVFQPQCFGDACECERS